MDNGKWKIENGKLLVLSHDLCNKGCRNDKEHPYRKLRFNR